jgi:hypothetical protein
MILLDLYRDYDGAIPHPLVAHALAGNDPIWCMRIALAAERQFQRLLLQALEQICFWRLRPPSLKTRQSLTCLTHLVQNYRQKAYEAHLLAENAVYF